MKIEKFYDELEKFVIENGRIYDYKTERNLYLKYKNYERYLKSKDIKIKEYVEEVFKSIEELLKKDTVKIKLLEKKIENLTKEKELLKNV